MALSADLDERYEQLSRWYRNFHALREGGPKVLTSGLEEGQRLLGSWLQQMQADTERRPARPQNGCPEHSAAEPATQGRRSAPKSKRKRVEQTSAPSKRSRRESSRKAGEGRSRDGPGGPAPNVDRPPEASGVSGSGQSESQAHLNQQLGQLLDIESFLELRRALVHQAMSVASQPQPATTDGGHPLKAILENCRALLKRGSIGQRISAKMIYNTFCETRTNIQTARRPANPARDAALSEANTDDRETLDARQRTSKQAAVDTLVHELYPTTPVADVQSRDGRRRKVHGLIRMGEVLSQPGMRGLECLWPSDRFLRRFPQHAMATLDDAAQTHLPALLTSRVREALAEIGALFFQHRPVTVNLQRLSDDEIRRGLSDEAGLLDMLAIDEGPSDGRENGSRVQGRPRASKVV